jgi:iron complex transport system substrate-binding protein
MPQVTDGALASIAGEEYVASVSPPTALSLTWGLDEYVTELSHAAERAQASS